MQIPHQLIESLEGIEGFDRKAFESVHASGSQITSVRINPLKKIHDAENGAAITHRAFENIGLTPVPWSDHGFYLSQRPSFTFDPLFHAGCYYVQEASSMFLEQALKQLEDLSAPIRVLDLCAAPGGKSTHIQSLIKKESLLVSNEVIKGRSNILTDNIIKWGGQNVIVTNNDPAAFKNLPGFFDVIVVDAPCSGSGLFRKDEEAITEWSLNNVALCCQRQQRILADALPALKEYGLLVYSTCSYSKEENEDIEDWLVNEMGMESQKLSLDPEWKIIETRSERTGASGYRFFPDKLAGEGFFLACFRKKEETEKQRYRPARVEKANPAERMLLDPYLKLSEDMQIIKEKDSFTAIPSFHLEDFCMLNALLNIQYKGVSLGQLMKKRLVPTHSLALSSIISGDVPVSELSYDEAILYLQKQDLRIQPPQTGWQLVSYQNHPLGWINALPNRINNYYPKELRILKQQNNTAFEK